MATQQEADQRALRLSRHYPVAPEKVWRAWTEAEALTRWFGPATLDGPVQADLDVRTGGRYFIRFATIDLVPENGGTRLDFVHDRFFDAQAVTNHARGWGASFGKLDAYIASLA